ncbi:spore coat protein [Bacillus licheniformis]|nr:spore coat protein [Bacillus licheniformis]
MADFEKLQENVDPIMKSVVKNILKNRGVTSDKVRTLSEEEKENIFNMLEDLKNKPMLWFKNRKKKQPHRMKKGQREKRTLMRHQKMARDQEEEETEQID